MSLLLFGTGSSFGAMLSVDSLQVAEEEVVVESSSSRLGDLYTLVTEGCYPRAMNHIRKKNLKRYAQKFIIDGERARSTFLTCLLSSYPPVCPLSLCVPSACLSLQLSLSTCLSSLFQCLYVCLSIVSLSVSLPEAYIPYWQSVHMSAVLL